jgi:DNA repair exonuclease SbcCD ATPase subunit
VFTGHLMLSQNVDRVRQNVSLTALQSQLQAEQRKTTALSALLRLSAKAFLSTKHELRRVSEFHGELVEEHAQLLSDYAEQGQQNDRLQSCMVDMQTQLARVCTDRTAAQEDVFQLQKQVQQQADALKELQRVNEEHATTLAELRTWETCLKSDLARAQAGVLAAEDAASKMHEQVLLLEQRLIVTGELEFVKMVHGIHAGVVGAMEEPRACSQPSQEDACRLASRKSFLEDAISAQADVDSKCIIDTDVGVVRSEARAGSDRRLSTIVKGVFKKLHTQEAVEVSKPAIQHSRSAAATPVQQ